MPSFGEISLLVSAAVLHFFFFKKIIICFPGIDQEEKQQAAKVGKDGYFSLSAVPECFQY